MASDKEAAPREGALSDPRKMFMTSRSTPPTSPIKSPSDSAKSFSFAIDDTSSGGTYVRPLLHPLYHQKHMQSLSSCSHHLQRCSLHPDTLVVLTRLKKLRASCSYVNWITSRTSHHHSVWEDH